MTRGITSKASPRGLMRQLMRLPIWLYQHGFGWLFGRHLLMLTHTGRKTGLPRYVVLEVVRYERDSATYTVAAGWGGQADWLRNVQANSQVGVRVGRRQFCADAEQLPIAQAADAFRDYAQRHPITFCMLSKLLSGTLLTSTPANFQRLARIVPVVALHPCN